MMTYYLNIFMKDILFKFIQDIIFKKLNIYGINLEKIFKMI